MFNSLEVARTPELCVSASTSVLVGDNDIKREDEENFTHTELTKKSPITALLSSIVLKGLAFGFGHPCAL